MKKLNFRIVLPVLFLFFLTVIGCRIRPFDDINFSGLESEWAVPLIDTDKTFGDIITGFDPKALVQIAADGSIILRYKGVFTAKSSLEIFSNFQNTSLPLTDTIMAIPFKLPQGVHIDSIFLKAGKLQLLFAASTEGPLTVTVRLPQLKKNGITYEKIFSLNASFYSDGIDLAGFDLKPLRDSIFITYDARKPNGEKVNLNNKGGINIQNFQASFAKGYFGQSIFDVPRDTIKIDFFNQWKGGAVKFGDPKLIATLDNSFGVPVRAIMKVGEITTLDGRVLQLQSPLAMGVDVAYPRINQIGQSKRTVVTFDNSNSNLAQIISENPVAIDYKIDGLMNPTNDTSITGFLTDSSRFNLQVELEVPMYGSARNFEVNDTFPINLAASGNITKAEFKILTDNGMPIEINVQGYFATETGQILDSLYAQKAQILKGAPVGANGLPTGISSNENLVTIEAAKLTKIRDKAKKLVVRYSFSTTNSGSVPVKLLSKQGVRLRIGVKFGYKTP